MAYRRGGSGGRRAAPAPAHEEQSTSAFLSQVMGAGLGSPPEKRAREEPPPKPAAARAAPKAATAATKRRRVARGLELPRKFQELAQMFDAIATVADLRARRGEPPLFTAIVAAAANIYGRTGDARADTLASRELGKRINGDHIRQMQVVAEDMIRFVERGRNSTVEVLQPIAEGQPRMNPIALQSRRSRHFRKKLLRITRRHYHRFLEQLPPDARPDHTAATATAWDARFKVDEWVPDIVLPGAAAPAAAAAAPAAPAQSAAASSTPATAAPKAKLAAGSADLVTPDPIDMRCAKGDAVEVQYAATWYPAVVRELQAPRVNGPPPRVLVHVHGWDAASDAWEPLASDKLRKQQAGAKAEVRSRHNRPDPRHREL